MLIYATPADLAEWTGADAPVNAAALLRSASVLVQRETRSAVYAVQPSGLPKEQDEVIAFREATCAQAAFWAANNIDPNVSPIPAKPVAVSKSIKGASVTYDPATVRAASDARSKAVTTVTDEVWAILDNAGLVNQQPWAYA